MENGTWIVVVLAAVGIFASIVGKRGRRRTGAANMPYEKEMSLLTPAERSFFGVLEATVDSKFRILIKVRVADVLRVKRGLPSAEWRRAFSRIESKHFDFVLCRQDDLDVVAAIELDDSSHQKANRIERDRFLDEACRAAGVPLIRFAARRGYMLQEVREKLAACDAGLISVGSQPRRFGGEDSGIARGSRASQAQPEPEPKIASGLNWADSESKR